MATKPPVPSTDAVKQLALKAVASGVTRVVATLVDPNAAAKRVIEDVRELPAKAAGLPLKVALEVVAAGEKVRALLPGSKAAVVAEKVADKAREVGEAVEGKAVKGDTDGADGWDAAAPAAAPAKPDPAEYVPPVMHDKAAANPVEVAAAKATPAAVPLPKPPVKKAPAKKAPSDLAPAKAPKVAPVKVPTSPVKLAAPPATLTEAVKESVIAALDEPLGTPAPEPADDAPVATVTPIHAGRDGHREVPFSPEVEAAIEAAPDGATMPAKELPIAGYDNLSLPQLRAKLAKLDVVAVTQLRDHELSHGDRAPIVTMLESRIAKLAAVPTPTTSI